MVLWGRHVKFSYPHIAIQDVYGVGALILLWLRRVSCESYSMAKIVTMFFTLDELKARDV